MGPRLELAGMGAPEPDAHRAKGNHSAPQGTTLFAEAGPLVHTYRDWMVMTRSNPSHRVPGMPARWS